MDNIGSADSIESGQDTMGRCAFCAPDQMEWVLRETEHFVVLADHAPMVAGHLLIIPRQHYACYGAVPTVLEPELLALKRDVVDFLSATYGVPTFFEHGVFRQTVFHAHLHALPFGALPRQVSALDDPEARVARSLADLRAWYAERGAYFSIEPPAMVRPESAPRMTIFPPRMDIYVRVLGTLRTVASPVTPLQPQAVRRLTSKPKVRGLVDRWRDYWASPRA